MFNKKNDLGDVYKDFENEEEDDKPCPASRALVSFLCSLNIQDNGSKKEIFRSEEGLGRKRHNTPIVQIFS